MTAPRQPTAGQMAELDEAWVELAADLDRLLGDQRIRQSLADGLTAACMDLTLRLDAQIRTRLGLAGLAAAAILRLIERNTQQPTAPAVEPADRQLLVDVRRWARANGWHLLWSGWANAMFLDDATVVVDWDDDELFVKRRAEGKLWAMGLSRGERFPVTSVRQAIDFLVALDVLPARFSSAYRAAGQATPGRPDHGPYALPHDYVPGACGDQCDNRQCPAGGLTHDRCTEACVAVAR